MHTEHTQPDQVDIFRSRRLLCVHGIWHLTCPEGGGLIWTT